MKEKLARIIVMRYDKGKRPLRDYTDEEKIELGECLRALFDEHMMAKNIVAKFNGIFVNHSGRDGIAVGLCDWDFLPSIESVKDILESMNLPYANVIRVLPDPE